MKTNIRGSSIFAPKTLAGLALNFAVTFLIFYLPLHFLEYWALAFPPWLLVVLLVTPILSNGGDGDPSWWSLLWIAVPWFLLSASLLVAGFRTSRPALTLAGLHFIIPPTAIVLSVYIAVIYVLHPGN